MILKQIQADKLLHTANSWVTRTNTKKQRDMLTLHDLENPPLVLKNSGLVIREFRGALLEKPDP